MTLTFNPVTWTFYLWPWTFAAYRLWRDETLYQIEVIAISVDLFDLMAMNTHKCYARVWDNFNQVWPSTTYLCLNYSVFWCWYVMSNCDLNLWPVDLKSSSYIKCHVIKICTKFERNRAIPGWIIDNVANFCTRYATPWPWPLDLDLLQHFGCYAFKLQSIQN